MAMVRKLTEGLITPGMDAVRLVTPIPVLVAKPIEDRVAMALLELVQVTFEVMSVVEPSE